MIIGSTITLRVAAVAVASLIAVSSVAGWSLWRLAGAGDRCDLRIEQAKARGSDAVRKLVAGQEAAIAVMRAEDDARLIAMQSSLNARGIERVTVYRDRISAMQAPDCRVSAEQVQAINEALQ